MQRFEFKDRQGTWGAINEEFHVDYAGEFREEVTDSVEKVADEYQDPPPERAILEVYCTCPIVEVERWKVESY